MFYGGTMKDIKEAHAMSNKTLISRFFISVCLKTEYSLDKKEEIFCNKRR